MSRAIKKKCSQIIFVWPADQWTDVEHCSRDCDPVSGQYQLRDLDTIIISCCMLLCHDILATLAIIEKENFLCQTAWTRKVYFSTKCGHCEYLSYLVTLIVNYLQQRQSSDGQISKWTLKIKKLNKLKKVWIDTWCLVDSSRADDVQEPRPACHEGESRVWDWREGEREMRGIWCSETGSHPRSSSSVSTSWSNSSRQSPGPGQHWRWWQDQLLHTVWWSLMILSPETTLTDHCCHWLPPESLFC